MSARCRGGMRGVTLGLYGLLTTGARLAVAQVSTAATPTSTPFGEGDLDGPGRGVDEEAVGNVNNNDSSVMVGNPIVIGVVVALVVLTVIAGLATRQHRQRVRRDSDKLAVLTFSNKDALKRQRQQSPKAVCDTPTNLAWDELFATNIQGHNAREGGGRATWGGVAETADTHPRNTTNLQPMPTDATCYLDSLDLDHPAVSSDGRKEGCGVSTPTIKEGDDNAMGVNDVGVVNAVEGTVFHTPTKGHDDVGSMSPTDGGSVSVMMSTPVAATKLPSSDVDISPPHATIDPIRTQALRAALQSHKVDRITLLPNRAELTALAEGRSDGAAEDVATTRPRAFSICVSPRDMSVSQRADEDARLGRRPGPGHAALDNDNDSAATTVTPRKRALSMCLSPSRLPGLLTRSSGSSKSLTERGEGSDDGGGGGGKGVGDGRPSLNRTVSNWQLSLPTLPDTSEDGTSDTTLGSGPTSPVAKNDSDTSSDSAVAPLSTNVLFSPRTVARRKRALFNWKISLLSDVTEEKSVFSSLNSHQSSHLNTGTSTDEGALGTGGTAAALPHSTTPPPLTANDVAVAPISRVAASGLLLTGAGGGGGGGATGAPSSLRDGHFLFRSANSVHGVDVPFAYLSYLHQGHVLHAPIVRRDDLFYVGVRVFATLVSVAEYYRACAPPEDIIACRLSTACRWMEADLDRATMAYEASAVNYSADVACEQLLDDIDTQRLGALIDIDV
eukprot:m.21463 g.21463  ORF g.21463 m.21463 type:complete len:728 (+) comp3898_c0_seq1:133-2316(+)